MIKNISYVDQSRYFISDLSRMKKQGLTVAEEIRLSILTNQDSEIFDKYISCYNSICLAALNQFKKARDLGKPLHIGYYHRGKPITGNHKERYQHETDEKYDLGGLIASMIDHKLHRLLAKKLQEQGLVLKIRNYTGVDEHNLIKPKKIEEITQMPPCRENDPLEFWVELEDIELNDWRRISKNNT